MRFQFKAELSAMDVARIKAAEAVETKLFALHDSAWLAEDLRAFDYIFWNKFKGKPSAISPINKSLGWFVDTDEAVTKDFFFPNTRKNCSKQAHAEMHLQIRVDAAGIMLFIYGNRLARLCFGPFFSDANEAYVPGINDKLVFELAKYFYARREQYVAVYACLLKYQEEFTEIFGKKLVEDLLLLFSVPNHKEELPNFDFSEKEIKTPLFCQALLKKDINWEMPSLNQAKATKLFTWLIPAVDTLIYLEEGSTLKIFSDYRDKATTLPPGVNTNKFPTIRANDALKQIVAFAAFGLEIYEKIKSRILVENI
jgi:hypothetical protein